MKNVFLLFIMLLLFPGMAHADASIITNSNNTTVNKIVNVKKEVTEVKNTYVTENKISSDPVELGLKADIKILNLTDKVSLGTELSKDFYHKNAAEGYAAYLKINIDLTK